ncbi:sterile alpha motif domain-containing 3-like protein [Labeo rohita]|uniref:Sterile alpha motif domain-containing 3-like protein n=1 Tax=Labeo rohita TaxID=84645 RepID=A0A498MWS8_LABRO|nr:sterile alpha motif domain-containing 3-like protein [Labeo rohita]
MMSSRCSTPARQTLRRYAAKFRVTETHEEEITYAVPTFYKRKAQKSCDCINVKRECVLKALFVYLNENPDNLIKECMDADFSNAEAALKEMVIGVFVIRCEGCEVGDEPADVGVVLEGVTALEGLALLMHYVVKNITYPSSKKCMFET